MSKLDIEICMQYFIWQIGTSNMEEGTGTGPIGTEGYHSGESFGTQTKLILGMRNQIVIKIKT